MLRLLMHSPSEHHSTIKPFCKPQDALIEALVEAEQHELAQQYCEELDLDAAAYGS